MGVELKKTDTAIECCTVRFFVGTVWLVLHEEKKTLTSEQNIIFQTDELGSPPDELKTSEG